MLFSHYNNNIVNRRNFLKIAGLGSFGMAACAGNSFNLESLIARPKIENQPLLSPIYQIGLCEDHNTHNAMLSYITLNTEKNNQGRITFRQPVKAAKVSERKLFNMVINNVLVEGLEPGQNYAYSVEDYGIGGVIKTAHTDDRDFNFILESDTQCWYANNKVHKSLRKSIVKQMLKEDNPRFLMNCGDITQRGTLDDWLKNFFPYYEELLPNMPFYPVRGNHDTWGFGFWHVFGKWVEAEGVVGNSNKTNYSFDYGNVHFTVLNSNTGSTNAAKKFLEKDLKNSKAKFNLVFYHHPFKINTEGFPISAVFTGHEHKYVHYCDKKTKAPHIITGGGCDKLDEKGDYFTIPRPNQLTKEYCSIIYHYISMHVTKGKIFAKVKDKEGIVRDTFEILPLKK